jgi:hypothetical protein
MKKFNVLLVLLLFLLACHNEVIESNSYCQVDDPLVDLPWLKSIVEVQKDNKYCKMIISKYEYQQNEGFLVDSCADCLDSLAIFYNCSGEKICEFGGLNNVGACPDFVANAVKKGVIFKDTIIEKRPDSYFCQVDNPLEDLIWLKNIVDAMKSNRSKAEIYRGIYDGKDGFLIDMCVKCPDGLVQFMSCGGAVLCEFGGIDGRITCPDFEQKTTNLELIFEIK